MSIKTLKQKMKECLRAANEIEINGLSAPSTGDVAKVETIYQDFQMLHKEYVRQTGKIWDKS